MSKRRWNSIAEIIIVITILTFWLVWSYSVLNSGQKLATSTENRIKWTNIAREWIEIVQNIRDSNWIKFSSDYKHCWNVKDYQSGCIWTDNTRSFDAKSYIPYFENWSWKLEDKWASPSLETLDTAYKTSFPVFLDSNWLISQTWSSIICSTSRATNCKTIFYREIKISYPVSWNKSDDKFRVNSIVKWTDNSQKWINTINLQTTLTNWKEDL
ncbi:MAG: hypothetical protein ACD_3C00037G0011 [uncultured bacterium (gcode 4)]|uniref:Uncharacterized protein n=1 Tax=uncultured bacterium (gcode 4) TaxID=1234023 RepID=K2GYW1_9BACT|nr:MAG: hypothetical protein ACD_3C00037G0011 [uncultured bacterium (gcode 4)]